MASSYSSSLSAAAATVDQRDHAFCRSMQMLLPYFYCGMINRLSVDEQCFWDQRHAAAVATTTTSSHHHHHHHQQQQQQQQRHCQKRRTNNSIGVDTMGEDAYFYDASLLAWAMPHCTHYVTIVDSVNVSLIGKSIRVPGIMLIRFMDRIVDASSHHSFSSPGDGGRGGGDDDDAAASLEWQRTRRHIETHCRRPTSGHTVALSLVLDTLLGSGGAEPLWRAAQAEFLPMPHGSSNESIGPLWLIDEATLVGRYSQCVLSSVRGAMRGPIETQGRRLYVVDEVSRQRVMMLIRFDLERVYSHSVASTLVLIEHDPAQRDAIVALLGVGNYSVDFDPVKDVRIALVTTPTATATASTLTPSAVDPLLSETDIERAQRDIGLRLATACSVCSDNVAQIAVLPCRHLTLCIGCAIRTYALSADHLLPNGMPRLMATARCVSCNQPARSCCRILGVTGS